MRLAVDALGGDNAPGEIVRGALSAARRLPDDEVLLVGPEEEVRPHLGADAPPNVSLRPSGGTIGMDEEPAAALRARPDAGVSVAAKMVRAGGADAFFSAGNTGATVAAALMRIGRMDGVRRPAISTLLPFASPVMLLDAGATTMCRPQDLLNFAILGGVFAERYFGLGERARIGLVNVGEEPGKGTDLAKEAHALISGSGLRFVGNVEGRDVSTGVADVLVTDGFTGNVLLKGLETAYATAGPPAPDTDLPPRAALLLGVGGTVVVCHGAATGPDLAAGIGFAADLHRRASVAAIADLLRYSEVSHD